MVDIVDTSDALRSAMEPGRLLGGPTVVPLDVVPFAMLVADASGSVRVVNQAWMDASGIDARSSRGSGWLASVAENDRPSLLAVIQRVGAGFGPAHCHYRWMDGDRGATWRVVAIERAGEILVGIGVDLDPMTTQIPAAPAPPQVRAPEPTQVRAPEPAAASLRLVTEPAHEDPLAPAVAGLFRSLDALLMTIDRLAERLEVSGRAPAPAPAFEPQPA